MLLSKTDLSHMDDLSVFLGETAYSDQVVIGYVDFHVHENSVH